MNKYILMGGVSLVSMGIGAGVSYLATRKFMIAKYEELIETELNEAKAYYRRLNKKEEFSSPVEVLKSYQSMTDTQFMSEQHNIDIGDGGPVDGFQDDGEVEAPTTTDEPYVISRKDYENTNKEYDKVSFTYYETDDILIDDGTVPLDADDLIGLGNLDKFGYGSGHKNIVYIRNEHLESDFVVTRSDGDFSEEVLGYIEHSSGPGKVLKFHREEE